MTQEEKQLLLKDLCARLPHGVMCEYTDVEDDIKCTATLGYSLRDFVQNKVIIKPYLRPMSSMTDDEKITYNYLLNQISITQDMLKVPRRAYHLFHWLLASHFDYYGLIEKGLALEAPEGMYKTE